MPDPNFQMRELCESGLLPMLAPCHLHPKIIFLAAFVLILHSSETFGRYTLARSSRHGDQEEFQLPKNVDEPFLILDYTGGFRAPAKPGDAVTPFLRVFPDGRVIAGGASPNSPIAEIKIDEQHLRELVIAIVETDRFFDVDSNKINQAINASGKRITIVDAPDTEITLLLADRRHHVKQYATMFLGRQYGEIKPLANLLATEKRLRILHAVVQIGGYDRLVALLKAVNDECRRRDTSIPLISADDLTWATRQKDGRLEISFNKLFRHPDSQLQMSVAISAKVSADGSHEINVGDPVPRGDK